MPGAATDSTPLRASIPTPIWVVLFFTAGILLVFMLFFADSGERAVVQGFMMGAVTAVIVATLLTLGVLNRPYSRDFGGLQPTAMQRTLGTLEAARDALNLTGPHPLRWAGRSGHDRAHHRPARPIDRYGGRRPVGAGRGRHGVEQLPGEPVDG